MTVLLHALRIPLEKLEFSKGLDLASLPDQGGVSSQGRTPHNGFQDNDKYLEDSIRKRSMVLGPPSPWTPCDYQHGRRQKRRQKPNRTQQ